MITIRESQLAVFQQARTAAFVQSMVEYIAAEYPKHFGNMGESETRAFVERSMAAANALRIDTEGAVGALTELRLLYGESLERAPDREWARNILAHARLPDYVRVEAVQNRLMERLGGRVLIEFSADD